MYIFKSLYIKYTYLYHTRAKSLLFSLQFIFARLMVPWSICRPILIDHGVKTLKSIKIGSYIDHGSAESSKYSLASSRTYL